MITSLAILIWEPAFSPVAILSATGLLCSLAIFAYARQWKSAGWKALPLLLLRIAAVVTLSLLLLGPGKELRQTQDLQRPQIQILVDQSGSMSVKDADEISRSAFAMKHWLNTAQLRELSQHFDVTYHRFADDFTPLSAEELEQLPASPKGTSSPIANALDELIKRHQSTERDSSIVLFSDGIDTNDATLMNQARAARLKGLRIHTVSLGASHLARDLAITVAPGQRFLFAREKGQLKVRVFQVGYAGQPVTIRIQSQGEEIVHEARLPEQGPLDLSFDIKEERAGEYDYKVSVDLMEGEREAGNNVQQVFQPVIDSKIKVLVLEGEPFWDTKFLAHSLRKDERVELHTLTQLSVDQRNKIITGEGESLSAPENLDALAEYDVVIIGRSIEKILNEAVINALPDYVAQRGGHLIFARGQAYDTTNSTGRNTARILSPLEPVIWGSGKKSNLSWHPTPSGQQSPVFAFADSAGQMVDELPLIPAFTSMPVVDREKPAARTLAWAIASRENQASTENGQGIPGLLMMPYGRGRVAMLCGEGLWRWRLAPSGLDRFHGYYDQFWSNLVRWLAMASDFQPGQQLTLNLPSTQSKLNDTLQIGVTMKAAGHIGPIGELEVVLPDGQVEQLPLLSRSNEPSRRYANFTPKQNGVHQVRLTSTTLSPPQQVKRFSVYEDHREMLELSTQMGTMNRLADNAGGIAFDQREHQDWINQLQAQNLSISTPGEIDFIWDQWWILLLVLGWLGTEWIIRRKVGMS